MLRGVIHRRRLLLKSGENSIALLTMNRAVRNEATYFIIQALMFFTSFWAIFKVSPVDQGAAIQFYFATLGVRAIVSILLVVSSWKDWKDRQKLKIELDLLHPDTPPSDVG